MKVTGVITTMVLLTLSLGCEGNRQQDVQVELPEQKIVPPRGASHFIMPAALLDSIQKGRNIQVIFIEDDLSPNIPVPDIHIPNVISMPTAEFTYTMDTMSTARRYYLMCAYGNDSRRLSTELARRGVSSYWVDGGNYRLTQEVLARQTKPLGN